MNNAAAKQIVDRAKTLAMTTEQYVAALGVEEAARVAWENAQMLINLREWRGVSPDCYGEFIDWAKGVGLVGDYVPTMPYDLEPEAYACWEAWSSTRCWVSDGDEFHGET